MQAFEDSDIAKTIANYRLPRYDELMKFDVFMKQLTEILDEYLSIFEVPGEAKILTASMINNYVFKQVIQPPKQKKYSRVHVIHLLIIGILKSVLSLSDIAELISAQIKEYPMDIAYNYFCSELENALHTTFAARDFGEIEKNQPTKITPLTSIARSAVLSFANQIYVKQRIYYEAHKN